MRGALRPAPCGVPLSSKDWMEHGRTGKKIVLPNGWRIDLGHSRMLAGGPTTSSQAYPNPTTHEHDISPAPSFPEKRPSPSSGSCGTVPGHSSPPWLTRGHRSPPPPRPSRPGVKDDAKGSCCMRLQRDSSGFQTHAYLSVHQSDQGSEPDGSPCLFHP